MLVQKGGHIMSRAIRVVVMGKPGVLYNVIEFINPPFRKDGRLGDHFSRLLGNHIKKVLSGEEWDVTLQIVEEDPLDAVMRDKLNELHSGGSK
jgi:hypothetical protein